MTVNKNKDQYIGFGRAFSDFQDLITREEKRSGINLGCVDEYLAYADGRKNTVVLLFDAGGEFLGAGTAIRSPIDKYNAEAGFRKAAVRALRSITVHTKKPDGKRVRLDVR